MVLLLCNLGIRGSDLPQINKGNIAKIKGTNTISIKMRKTNKQVTIPINPIAMQIIEKYNYELPNVSEQILNKEIKNICKIAGLDREFNIILQDLGGIDGPGSEMLRMHIIKKILDKFNENI